MHVGWSLFWAFLLLALLHVVQSATQFHAVTEFGIMVEVMYALISLLLLTSMVHLETVLKERQRLEREEQRMRVELESEVKKKTAYLMRAIEELQAEMDERKHMEEEVDTVHLELRAVSRQARMARIATDVLASVGEMIQSVNATASLVSDHVKQSKIAKVVHVGTLIREHATDLGHFMAHDPRGQKLPTYIAQLAEHLATEQAGLLGELESLKRNLEKIAAMQQEYSKLAGVADLAGVTPVFQDMPNHNQPEQVAGGTEGQPRAQASGGGIAGQHGI
jgi:hypothetical protein